MNCRRGKRFTAISGRFGRPASGARSMTGSASRCERHVDENPPPAPPSLTASPSRPPKKGASRVRRRQENQWKETPYRRRHPRIHYRPGRPRGLRTGPRRGQAGPGALAQGVPPSPTHLGRRRLCGPVNRMDKKAIALHPGNRQAKRRRQRICRPAQTMDRGTHLWMARAISKTRKGLRATD